MTNVTVAIVVVNTIGETGRLGLVEYPVRAFEFTVPGSQQGWHEAMRRLKRSKLGVLQGWHELDNLPFVQGLFPHQLTVRASGANFDRVVGLALDAWQSLELAAR